MMAQLIAVSWLVVLLMGDGATAVEGVPASSSAHMTVQGEIIGIRSGLVYVKTPAANYTLRQKTVPVKAKVGDTVTLSMNHHHAVIDLHGQDGGQRHRSITGTLLHAENAQHLKLWTPQGDMVYSLAGHEAAIRNLREGTMVTVEVDQAGTVVDLYPVETEAASCDKRHHCKVMVHGKVASIESGMIFIRTPVVEYELPSNVAPKDARPGDEMTVWVNENNVVLDDYRTGETKRRRFITGNVYYVGNAKDQIKLWTPEGEKILALQKAIKLEERRPVTVEVDEADVVIDIRQSP